MLKQATIKLNNLTNFEIKDGSQNNHKTVYFKGSGYSGMQQDIEDIFFYNGGDQGSFNIYNIHYKNHIYDPEHHTATLTLEEICNGKGMKISDYNSDRIDNKNYVINLKVSQDENNRIVGTYKSGFSGSYNEAENNNIEAEFFLL